MILLDGPETTAVDLSTVKAHLRISSTDDDSYLTQLINVATELWENETDTTLIESSYRLQLDNFPTFLNLRRPPLLTVDEVSYQLDGQRHVLDSSCYQVDRSQAPGRLKFLQTAEHDSVIGGIWVEFTAGHETAAEVPASAKHALLLIVSHLYENREATTTQNVKDLPLGLKWLASQERWKFYG